MAAPTGNDSSRCPRTARGDYVRPLEWAHEIGPVTSLLQPRCAGVLVAGQPSIAPKSRRRKLDPQYRCSPQSAVLPEDTAGLTVAVDDQQ